MSKSKHDTNYLTAENGCSIVEYTSQRQRGPACSILSSDPKSVWVTSQELPQQVVISLKKIIRKPSFYNSVGFYCWHEYDSNPSLIQVWTKTQQQKWQLVSKTRLRKIDVWQYFRIQQLQADKVKQIKILITQNFGDSKTYLNKIGLFCFSNAPLKEDNNQNQIEVSVRQQNQYEQNYATANNNIQPLISKYLGNMSSNIKNQLRQKTQSQYQKTDRVEQLKKQLKKANDKINKMSQEQQIMKKAMVQQEKVIIRIQQTLKSVISNMDKMQKIHIVRSKEGEEQIMLSVGRKRKEKQRKRENQQQQAVYQVQQNRPSRQRGFVNKNSTGSDQIEGLKKMVNKMEKQLMQNLNYENSQNKQKQRSKQKNKQKEKSSSNKIKDNDRRSNYVHTYTPAHDTDVIRANSEDDLSEYSHPNYRTSQAELFSAIKGNKAMMYERLVKLIELKAKKKLELKNSGAKHNSRSRSKRMSIHGDQQASDSDDNYHAGFY